ncbi:MAG: transposase [Flavobacteriales bacterium]|nr:transposase [Flavobacteriales bacterium]
MNIKKPKPMSFSGLYVEKRTRRNKFFTQINTIIDWAPIETELLKIRGVQATDAAGNPSYNPLIIFKMMLLQTWYGLSDPGVEDMVNENLSAMGFCGLMLEDDVPDHSTISRFRKDLTTKNAMDRLLNKINAQLEKRNVIIKSGIAVDASITDSPYAPKGKTTWEVSTDRKEDERGDQDKDQENSFHKIQKHSNPGTDPKESKEESKETRSIH